MCETKYSVKSFSPISALCFYLGAICRDAQGTVWDAEDQPRARQAPCLLDYDSSSSSNYEPCSSMSIYLILLKKLLMHPDFSLMQRQHARMQSTLSSARECPIHAWHFALINSLYSISLSTYKT